ncbi:MAG: macrocin O-methyltransferase [Chitinophagaceae bacterium]|nr:MAG: macrocin O-methyltransferase [Chitinophagaceae bacterium]
MILIDKLFRKFGYVRAESIKILTDLWTDKDFVELHNLVRPFTMTSPERMYSLYNAMRYIGAQRIPGDLVECGVWKGGSSMIMARMLVNQGDEQRGLFLYDTFEGMSAPGAEDIDVQGNDAGKLLQKQSKDDVNSIWCYSTLDEVQANLQRTGFPASRIEYVKGKVEDTIPGTIPEKIALLRLDTDWYDSTYHELTHLFPLLQPGGLLIIDDYGYWQGARKAVDQYFQENNLAPLLHRIDDTGRIYQKI